MSAKTIVILVSRDARSGELPEHQHAPVANHHDLQHVSNLPWLVHTDETKLQLEHIFVEAGQSQPCFQPSQLVRS